MTTVAPALAIASDAAAPIPDPPPVTIATLPVKFVIPVRRQPEHFRMFANLALRQPDLAADELRRGFANWVVSADFSTVPMVAASS
jgi:hypothetical protein